MMIRKRNGQMVPFIPEKIKIAISKANSEMKLGYIMTEAEIKNVVNKVISHVEDMHESYELINSSSDNAEPYAVSVEDIQDFVEDVLIEGNYGYVAKAYIKYRYKHELKRKANTTDEAILSLIANKNKSAMEENSNKNAYIASTQRDLIAGEVSRDLTTRLLLPEKISEAHNQGILHFHDADYFIQNIFNCCLINIQDILDNGTVMNGKMIESPKSFRVACTIMTQVIAAVASSQYGLMTAV